MCKRPALLRYGRSYAIPYAAQKIRTQLKSAVPKVTCFVTKQQVRIKYCSSGLYYIPGTWQTCWYIFTSNKFAARPRQDMQHIQYRHHHYSQVPLCHEYAVASFPCRLYMYQTPSVQNEVPKCRHFVTIKGCLNLGRYYVIDSYLPDTGAYMSSQSCFGSFGCSCVPADTNRTE